MLEARVASGGCWHVGLFDSFDKICQLVSQGHQFSGWGTQGHK